MPELFPKPAIREVDACVRRCFPTLPIGRVRLLSEGWDSWAYEAVGAEAVYIFRVPKHPYTISSQTRERKLMPVIAPLLPLTVPDIAFSCDDGPGTHPFVGYRKIAGVPLAEMPERRLPDIGAPLGRFLKALHSIPVEDPRALGFEAVIAWRDEIGQLYEKVIRRVFPLIACESREPAERTFEAFLNDDSNFAFEPCIIHGDLGPEHVLVDADSGALAGVIDFGDVTLGDPAHDFTSILKAGLGETLGVQGVDACLKGYGSGAEDFARRCQFYAFLLPFHEVLGGLSYGMPDVIESGLRRLAEPGRD
ncbi:MAG TPA: aminoglycoside phosphotransferase family protein [Dehalococcoidia bacterium]